MEITAEDHSKARHHVLQFGSDIFNPNRGRTQSNVSSTNELVKRTSEWLRKHGFMYGRKCGDAVFLHSIPGCKQQQWHTDFDTEAIRKARKKPLGVILALEDKTSFETPSKRYQMSHGDILIFEGDAVHAGSAYDVSNTRMHIYIDTVGCPRQNNKTYPIRRVKKRRLRRTM
jgi:ectoine hydroxylase-related dioxygenase (phytanoyl-CoA dioxygenase family)